MVLLTMSNYLVLGLGPIPSSLTMENEVRE